MQTPHKKEENKRKFSIKISLSLRKKKAALHQVANVRKSVQQQFQKFYNSENIFMKLTFFI